MPPFLRGQPRRVTRGAAAAVLMAPAAGLGVPLLNLRSVYAHWWAVIDLAVFFVLFAGIVHATVGRHFERRGERFVTFVVGGGLALATLGLEWASRSNLSVLPPSAAGAFLVALALAVFWLFRTLNVRPGNSIVFTLVVLAVADAAIWPGAAGPLMWFSAGLQVGALAGVGAVLATVMFGRGRRVPARRG